MDSFGDKLKKFRLSKNMTQKEVASAMGISQQAYGQYESGNRRPKIDTIVRIADALCVDIDSFIGAEAVSSERVQITKRAAAYVRENYMDEKTIEAIKSVLAKGDRVELIPVKDGVKVIQVKRKEIKITSNRVDCML